MSSIASAQPVRIVIADEHPILREGLRRLLESRPGHHVAGESGDAASVIALVRDLEPDVLLLGRTTGRRVPPETIEQVAALRLPVRTIVLTPSLRHEDALDAVRRGARGVISTHTAPDVLFQAIEIVIHGGIWVGLQPASDAKRAFNPDHYALRCPQPSAFGLTPREIEILRAVVNGETNKGIASRCAISENTVKRHVMHLFDKVGASNRVELALFAQHHALTHGL
jgi:DNA-binding NarL/FixJ family response regulator